MEAAQFEKLMKGALDKFAEQGLTIDNVKAELERMTGRVETLAALNPAKSSFVQKVRGIEVPWESKEHAAEFSRFLKAVAKKDLDTIAKIRAVDDAANENTEGGGSDVDGGYLVPTEFKPTLLRIIEQWGVARQVFQIVPLTRDEMQFPVYSGGWVDTNGSVNGPCYWPDENTDITKTWPQFTNTTLQIRKLAALIPASNELLQDAAIPFASLLATLVGEFIAKEEDRVGFCGTTAGNADKFNGVVTAATGGTVTAATTSISSITAEDLLDMQNKLSRGALDGAGYYMNRTVFDIVRKLRGDGGGGAGTGPFIVEQPVGQGMPVTIWGRPVTLVESLPAYTGSPSASTRYVVFGNMKNMYMGDRMGLSVASTDLVGFAAFQTHFRFVERIGFKCALPTAFSVLATHA